MQITSISDIDFAAADGSLLPDCPAAGAAGWDAPVDGLRWARGRQTRLVLPKPEPADNLVLLVKVTPYLVPPVLTAQTLRIRVNGVTACLHRVTRRTLIVRQLDPAMVQARDALVIEFDHPDVVQPNMVSRSTDSRGYSIGFTSLSLARFSEPNRPRRRPAQRRTALPPATAELNDKDLMHAFCSIGDNCEFGVAQRHFGAEPLDLLRFVGSRPVPLVRGLASGFAGVADLTHLKYELHDSGNGEAEYILVHKLYEFSAHTLTYESAIGDKDLLSREVKKLTMQQRLFEEDLLSARRIFVYKHGPATQPDVVPVLKEVRRWGPNTLLWVRLSDAAHPPGTVEWLGEGWLCGYIDVFRPYDNVMGTPSLAWLDICRNAHALWREALLDRQPAACAEA